MNFDLWRFFFNIKLHKAIFSFSIGLRPTHPVNEAFTSQCADLKHVLFLDYDKTSFQLVEQELHMLQHYFRLPPIYLFASWEEEYEGIKFGNYHAISLAKMNFDDIIKIQNQASIDYAYRRMYSRTRFKSWVLRSTKKGKRDPPKFLKMIGENKNLNRKISGLKLLELHRQYDNIPYIKYTNLDSKDFGSDMSFWTNYLTRCRTQHG